MVNVKDEKTFQVLNRGLLQLGRWLLLLTSMCAGTYLFLGGKSTGFGILLLLVGLWLVFDNPLESFETLAGSCPSCGHQVRNRRCPSFRCPECGSSIMVSSDSFYLEDDGEAIGPDPGPMGGPEEIRSPVEPLEISPGDTLDLHTFSPKEIPSLLDEFIRLAQKADIKCISIIHGKGTGALRQRVRGLLAKDPRVVAFHDSPPKSGGWGATVVELRPRQEND